ncbi:hypothetical protein KGQ71_04580, partial [Patescibacteria group bacterium]|nr:hypothetical protein [Patescibacteria group bacterium]
MKRSHLLFSIVSTYLCLGIVLIGWSIEAFAASSPDISLAVKGASSDGDPASTLPLPSIAPYPTVGNGPIYVQANEFALYNPESGKVLIRSKTMDPVAIASTTKLMTTYLTTQYGNLDDVITVTPEAAGIGGSLMDLHTGEKISVRNLLYG